VDSGSRFRGVVVTPGQGCILRSGPPGDFIPAQTLWTHDSTTRSCDLRGPPSCVGPEVIKMSFDISQTKCIGHVTGYVGDEVQIRLGYVRGVFINSRTTSKTKHEVIYIKPAMEIRLSY
jgi:hypothetical protein